MLRVLTGITICVALVVAFMLSTTKADPLQPGTAVPSLKSVDEEGKAVGEAPRHPPFHFEGQKRQGQAKTEGNSPETEGFDYGDLSQQNQKR